VKQTKPELHVGKTLFQQINEGVRDNGVLYVLDKLILAVEVQVARHSERGDTTAANASLRHIDILKRAYKEFHR